jgi:hypothetical protein
VIEAIESFLTDPQPRHIGKYGPDDERVLEYIHGKLTNPATPDDELSNLRHTAKIRLAAYGIEA